MASEALDMSARDMSGVYSEEHQRNPAEEPQPEFSVNGANADVEMKEDTVQSSEKHPQSTTASAISPIAGQISTNVPNTMPSAAGSTGARSSPHPSHAATPGPPQQPIPHGSPTRVYLNQHVTPHLLEGMKWLAVHEPEEPLKWLSEFLAQKSKEVEGTSI